MPGRELAMHRIIQANIDRFRELLKTEPDEMKRAMETRLLAEEEAKLEKLPRPEKKKA
jgi:hypothetical protein